MKNHVLHSIRKDYRQGRLIEANMNPNPLKQFSIWLDQAMDKGVHEPTAMTLATVDQSGCPSTRIVLLKDLSQNGFVFFTNFDSRKGINIANNHHVALSFFWSSMERQIRIEGQAEKISEDESDEYFLSRPLVSRLGTYASPQSKVIPNREFLEQRMSEFKKRFDTEPIKRPDNWGGYRVLPDCIEFWQGGPARLHDRIRYSRKNEEWIIERLAP